MLPLPFLNMMEASTKKQDGPPLRFMTLFKPNGVHPPSWNISGGTEHDFRMSPLMQPFAKHKEDLIILDNLGDFFLGQTSVVVAAHQPTEPGGLKE